MLDPETLGQRAAEPSGGDFAYHLWAIRGTPDVRIAGMASFFTLSTPATLTESARADGSVAAGFGGYIALGPPLRGTNRLRPLLARIEERMIRDDPRARGWYIECRPDGRERDIFARVGFCRIPVEYRQPPLPGHPPAEAMPLDLMEPLAKTCR